MRLSGCHDSETAHRYHAAYRSVVQIETGGIVSNPLGDANIETPRVTRGVFFCVQKSTRV